MDIKTARKKAYEEVTGLRPDYRQWRSNWPLWTYDPATWNEHDGCWLGRLLFGPALLLNAWKRARPNVETDGEDYVPLISHAWLMAVTLQMRPSAPLSPDFRVGPDESRLLTEDLRDALLGEDGTLWDGLEGGLENETLFRRLVRHRVQSLRGDGPDESAEALGKELLRCVGLLLHGRSSTSLADKTVKTLDREAREIAVAVQQVAETGLDATVGFVARLLAQDPALAIGQKEFERLRRGRASTLLTAALTFHFPFLTPDELEFLRRETDESGSKLAYRLVTNRLEGDLAYSSYRNKISGG